MGLNPLGKEVTHDRIPSLRVDIPLLGMPCLLPRLETNQIGALGGQRDGRPGRNEFVVKGMNEQGAVP
jgi:hypothetical protein